MHTATNRAIHANIHAARRSYDDTETIAPLRKEDAGTHQRAYSKLQVLGLKFLGLVLARQIV
jgi:hypothetical protein